MRKNKNKKSDLKGIRKVFQILGPGFITGASDDDPSGIATYSQAGALFGYGQIWTAVFTLPFMVVIQEMCGRIGLVTGQSLSAVIKKSFSRRVLMAAALILLLANTINVGSNLGAMASSAQLLFGLPFYAWLIFLTVVIVILQILVPYPSYAKFLRYLAFSLFAYVITAFLVYQPWREIFANIITPEFIFKKEYLLNIVAIFGTTISPYLFFWEADQEKEEDIENKRFNKKGKVVLDKADISNMRLDTAIGMFFSNLIMFFIMITAAATLGANGVGSIETADQAAQALLPLAGQLTYVIFALGIIGTGMLAVPVMAGSASYAISEMFGWKSGLHYTFSQARNFYLVIIAITFIGVMINLSPIPPFTLLYYTAVMNGLAAPPIMALIILIANNRSIMGEYVNGRAGNLLGWAITIFMTLSGVFLVTSYFI